MKYIFIFASVLLGAVAQYLFKKGMNILNIQNRIDFQTVYQIIINRFIVSGLIMYGFSVLIWFFVLSKFELSKAYPFVSLGYLITLFLGYFLLNESLSLYKVVGISIIVIGVIILSKG